jgi:hypothetical protein
MNHHQIEKRSMYNKMLVFFANTLHSSIWSNFQRLVTEINSFVTNCATLDSYIQEHPSETKTVTEIKNNAFDVMIKTIVSMAQTAYVWAIDTNNQTLISLFNISTNEFISLPESSAFSKVKIIRDALAQNIASMATVDLSATDLKSLNDAIDNYEQSHGTKKATSALKIAGNQGLYNHMADIDNNLDIIDKLFVNRYSSTHADLVNEYAVNRNVEKLPSHHSIIQIHTTDAGTGANITGAIMAINGKTSTTDSQGNAEIIKIFRGNQILNVSHPLYAAQTIHIVVVRGKALEIEVKMVKI